MLFFWTFYLAKNPEEKKKIFRKNIKQQSLFNIDKKKCFLSSKY